MIQGFLCPPAMVLQVLWEVVEGVVEGVVLLCIWFWIDGWIFLHME